MSRLMEHKRFTEQTEMFGQEEKAVRDMCLREKQVYMGHNARNDNQNKCLRDDVGTWFV